MKTTTISNNELLLHLSLIPDVGPGAAISLIQSLGTKDQRLSGRDLWWQWACNIDLQELYSFTVQDCQIVAGLTPKIAQAVVDGLANKSFLTRELELLDQYSDIRFVTIFDTEYPELLKHISIPPLLLYLRGAKLEQNRLRLAVVGSRKCNNYAERVISSLVPEFIAHDWDIVSGGALGVDTLAHTVTVNTQGRTLVVFGSGLLELYPFGNKKLFDLVIAHQGTLVSTFPLKMEARPSHFPARNRIISGLSLGTLVVQAAEKSGALITAQYALDQGRQVFAVPGLVTDPLSVGCHNLIKQGAKLVASVEDIVEEFGTVKEKKVLEYQTIIPLPVITNVQQDALAHKSAPIQSSQVCNDPLLQYLDTARSVDELSCYLQKLPAVVQNDLFDLQLEGVVRQNHAGLWERLS